MADEEFDDEIVQDKAQSQEQFPVSEKPLIYVGPNIHKLGLERYTVFRGELPPSIEEAVNKIPEIMNLIIYVDELNSFTHKIMTPSSPERQYFSLIQRKMNDL